MSRQSVFDETVHHLRHQGRPSIEGGSCRYRGPDGTRCAAGFHIPDEMYHPGMEGLAACSYAVERALTHLTHDELEVVYELQRVHDLAALPDQVVHASRYRRVRDAMGDERGFLPRLELGLREAARHLGLELAPPGEATP